MKNKQMCQLQTEGKNFDIEKFLSDMSKKDFALFLNDIINDKQENEKLYGLYTEYENGVKTIEKFYTFEEAQKRQNRRSERCTKNGYVDYSLVATLDTIYQEKGNNKEVKK